MCVGKVLFQYLTSIKYLSSHAIGLNTSRAKLGNIRVIFPNFRKFACGKKYLKDNKHDSLVHFFISCPPGKLLNSESR